MKIKDILHEDLFHGTPHFVDKFSLDKIGSGEGNQAFGWGLYFASKKEIAEFYKKTLSIVKNLGIPPVRLLSDIPSKKEMDITREINRSFSNTLKIYATGRTTIHGFSNLMDFYNFRSKVPSADKKYYSDNKEKIENELESVVSQIKTKNPDISDERLESILDDVGITDKKYPYKKAYTNALEILEKYAGGNLYEIQIPDIVVIYSWDDPISSQSSIIQQAFEMDDNDITGEDAYRQLSKSLGSDKEASLFLHRKGISGHKYLDAFSRKKSDDSSYNYVIYDDQIIDIKNKLDL